MSEKVRKKEKKKERKGGRKWKNKFTKISLLTFLY